MRHTRRQFLKTATAVTLGFSGLHQILTAGRYARASAASVPLGYGPLVPDPQGIVDLPRGFGYRVISRAGERMDDGFYVPALPDGMAAFPGPGGTTLLVRNHEVGAGAGPERGPYGAGHGLFDRAVRERAYDAGRGAGPCLGGTTTLVYDTRRQRVEGQHLSLTGTVRNCAGGPTPWNSWITCEETADRAGELCAEDHGYNFEVPARAEARLEPAVPLKEMGRFRHEAVAVDPASGIVYQTEDVGDGLITRYIPREPGRLRAGGRLQALAVADRPSLDTRNWTEQTVPQGTVLDVHWVDLENVTSPDDDLRYQGFDRGAARFARGEGMWYGNDAVYFACTSGGMARKGQIWRYVPSPHEGTRGERRHPGRLELFLEPNDGALVDRADNLTVAPWGDVILSEDGPEEQYLVGVTPDGQIYKFGRNAVSTSEFAGSTFSPEGSTLFVNVQREGLTLAITGPWGSAGRGADRG